MRWTVFAVLQLALLVASLPASGQTLCRWAGAHGQTHFGDLRAAQGDCQPVDLTALPAINIQQPPAGAPSRAARTATRPRSRMARSTAASRSDCEAYRERIRTIEQQLRQGYREPAGSRLHARKRRWSELLYERCY